VVDMDDGELEIVSERYPYEFEVFEDKGVKNNVYLPKKIRTNIRERKLSDIMEEDMMLEQSFLSSTKTASLSFLQNEEEENTNLKIDLMQSLSPD